MKRLLDVVLSLVGLAVLSPLSIPVAIILKLTGEHYIFYKHKRIGRHGKPFDMLKFATMLKDSPNMGTGDITIPNDPRTLPFGRILRKTKINELPQLINVLRGDMSLIGPRPVTPKQFAYYNDTVKRAVGRVRPGLSGIGSLVFRDEEAMMTNSSLSPDEFYRRLIVPYKGDLEIWYVEHQSVWLDLLLIALTVWAVLFPSSTRYRGLLTDLPEPSSLALSTERGSTLFSAISATHVEE